MAKKELYYDPETQHIFCSGDWVLDQFGYLQNLFAQLNFNDHLGVNHKITIDGCAIQKMDSAGAWLLSVYKNKLEKQGITVDCMRFNNKQQTLLALVENRTPEKLPTPQRVELSWLVRIGKSTMRQFQGLNHYLNFIGQLFVETTRILQQPLRLRFNALAGIIYQTGCQALPIIALLSLMIGVVLTYQMGLQLRNYGANIYIVDLLGLSILREFGPLLTAIIIAGRTGSSFTAQLGMMKINQEIDALDTMGVTSTELLLLPRILGLVIALPLLTIWADIFGIVGGMIMSNNMLDITWYDFLERFPNVIPLKTLLIGLGKTPVFALLIASIGCFQGMTVKGSAESVGRNTTRSVVLGIFFIIVADAIFSIVFSKLKL